MTVSSFILLSTFQGLFPCSESISRYNQAVQVRIDVSVNPKPAVKPKPLTLRRERSDLTAGQVPRFATHYAEHSAGSGNNARVRCALMPPSTCLDEDTLLKCLEEFKRKRYFFYCPLLLTLCTFCFA